jgi:hypothetical protein
MREYGKVWMIKAIAKRAGFTINDVRIIWETFEQIAREIISRKDTLIMNGLFKIYIKEIAPFMGYDAVRRQKLMMGTTYKVVMSPSRTLLDLVRDSKQTTPIDDEEMELEDYE